MRNLFFVLGVKFVEKLTRKVTHLVCNFANGRKYEAACKWGTVSVTPEWVYECVRQVGLGLSNSFFDMGSLNSNFNKQSFLFFFSSHVQNQVVCPDNFRPKELTTQDRDAGVGLPSQFHTQFVPVASRDNGSVLVSHSDDREETQSTAGKNGCGKGEVYNRLEEIAREQSSQSKKAKLSRDDSQESDAFPVGEYSSNCTRPLKFGDGIVSENDVASSREVPDVADTIEDLLEHTSKVSTLFFFLQLLFIQNYIFSELTSLWFSVQIQEQKSPGRITEKNVSL